MWAIAESVEALPQLAHSTVEVQGMREECDWFSQHTSIWSVDIQPRRILETERAISSSRTELSVRSMRPAALIICRYCSSSCRKKSGKSVPSHLPSLPPSLPPTLPPSAHLRSAESTVQIRSEVVGEFEDGNVCILVLLSVEVGVGGDDEALQQVRELLEHLQEGGVADVCGREGGRGW